MKAKSITAVVFSMIFWSFSFVWFKIANKDYDPITIVFIRLCVAVTFLSLYLWITKGFASISKGDRKYFFMLAFFEPFLYFLGESFGLTYVSSTVGSVIISTIPVFAVIFAWIFYRERLKLINYAGVIISFIGVIIFITNRSGGLGMSMKGLVLLLLAVAAAVGYNMILHRLANKYSPIMIVNLQNLIGLILFLPLFLIFDLKKLLITGFIADSMSAIILLAIFASSGAFVLFAYSVRHIGVSRANVFCNLIPVFTAIFAFLLMGDKMTIRNIAGMAVVIAGLFLAQAGKRESLPSDVDMAGRSA